MESPFETIAVVVNKGIVPVGIDVVIAWNCDGAGGVSVSGTVIEKIRRHDPFGVYVAYNSRQDLNLSKPNWTPQKLKKGWVTWDGDGGWYWWPVNPDFDEDFGWLHPASGSSDGGEQLGEVMAEFLGCPDCTGYVERNCIWEVGQ